MSCGSVLEVFIADEFESTSASLIVIRAHFMDLFTQNARKGEIWLAKRKQDHKINIILICLRTTMRVFAHAPLLIATYITYEGALDLSRHPPPAATKPFVRACLFLRALRVWPCLEHHLGDGLVLRLRLEVFVQLPRWQNARLLFDIHSICVCSACRSFSRFIMSPLLSQLCQYTIPTLYHTRHVFSFFNSFSIWVVQLSTCFFLPFIFPFLHVFLSQYLWLICLGLPFVLRLSIDKIFAELA